MAQIHYITEKEFVPTNISHWNPLKTETEEGLYQIVYGVLQPMMTYDKIYDLIVRINKESKSEVVKRFKLDSWSKEVKAIIDKLDKLNKLDKRVLISIPFFRYLEEISYTINRFQFVLFAINEILAKGDGQMELDENPKYIYPIKDLNDVVEDFWIRFENRLGIAGKTNFEYYHALFHDELFRRGFSQVTDPISKMEYYICPSAYYKQPQRYFELYDFSDEDHKMLKVKYEQESNDDKSDNESDKKVNAKDMAGIVYFMLKEISEETKTKNQKKKLVDFINFVLDNSLIQDKDKIRKEDTVRNYIDGFKRKEPQSQRFHDTVIDVLKRYNFAIPEEIKQDTDTSTKHFKVR